MARAGCTAERTTAIERVIEIGDAAGGAPVLRDLYERLARAPGRPDLDALFDRLGVHEGVPLDERAPLAAIRRAITRTRAVER